MQSIDQRVSRRQRRVRPVLALLIAGALGTMAPACTQSHPSEGSQTRSAVEQPASSAGAAAQGAQATLTSASVTNPLALVPAVSVADVAERAVPSVVSISATRMVRAQPMNPFFHEFFGNGGHGGPGGPGMGPGMGGGPRGMPREQEQQGLGSGVVVTRDGVVLTNNHVVEQAEDVQVTLSDGRKFEAEVVGTDPQSDLAVLRIQGKLPAELTPIEFGDSSTLRLGDVVLAIGNPFGVGQTVTMGIVSAKGRSSVGIVDYEDFIQTDAAINPGNSGGALINLRGELVGINTAILSRSGGYQGIGFAIPTSMAKPIMASLLDSGKVARGWLGIAIQTVDTNLASAMGLEAAQGVLVSDVTPDSPAAKAGLRRGDVILTLDGKAMNDSSQLRNHVAAKEPGSTVALEIVRDGKKQRLNVALGTLPGNQLGKAEAEIGAREGLLSGVTVANLNPQLRTRFEVPDDVKSGVLVTSVEPGSRAHRVGLRPGDVILEFDRKPVDSVAALEGLNSKAKGKALLLVSRGGQTIFMALRE
jgi:serine protease Do